MCRQVQFIERIECINVAVSATLLWDSLTDWHLKKIITAWTQHSCFLLTGLKLVRKSVLPFSGPTSLCPSCCGQAWSWNGDLSKHWVNIFLGKLICSESCSRTIIPLYSLSGVTGQPKSWWAKDQDCTVPVHLFVNLYCILRFSGFTAPIEECPLNKSVFFQTGAESSMSTDRWPVNDQQNNCGPETK